MYAAHSENISLSGHSHHTVRLIKSQSKEIKLAAESDASSDTSTVGSEVRPALFLFVSQYF